MTCARGTTNRNARGSSRGRAARRAWLVETWRADVDAVRDHLAVNGAMPGWPLYVPCGGVTCPAINGGGEPACRCYRCGELLTVDTVTVDRIIPGCQGGTYRRNNIRPACGSCNSETGGATRARKETSARPIRRVG